MLNCCAGSFPKNIITPNDKTINPIPNTILATPEMLVIFDIQLTPLVDSIVTPQNITVDKIDIKTVFPSNTFLPTKAYDAYINVFGSNDVKKNKLTKKYDHDPKNAHLAPNDVFIQLLIPDSEFSFADANSPIISANGKK